MAVRGSTDPDRLRDALARALGDPYLRVGLPLRDAAGVPLPESPAPGRARLEVHGTDRLLAVVDHDDRLRDSPELLASARAATAATLENATLQADLQQRFAEVDEARRRVVEAADEARRRIERDLHDGAQQRLLSLAMALSADAGTAPAADEVLETWRELRDLSRGIAPPLLAEAGLAVALTSLAEHAAVPCRLRVSPLPDLSRAVELAAYFTASEALANATKHAGASSVVLDLRRAGDDLRVEVADDGRGGANPDGSGLRGLRDRALALGGTLRVLSPPGEGTRVVLVLPLHGRR